MASLPAPDNGLLLLGVPFFRSVFVVHDLTDPRSLKYALAPMFRTLIPIYQYLCFDCQSRSSRRRSLYTT